ncbi:MAG: ABC transporter substrate-binding protein [Bacillota bacterium]|nr:ABC transporter substrate-binding protein [Bacillota bacterium]MDW7684911.1 ABC transporter substrate-binding protein [Bacillota bacterium]
MSRPSLFYKSLRQKHSPTVFIGYYRQRLAESTSGLDRDNWKESIREFSYLLNRQKQGAGWIEKYENKIALAKSELRNLIENKETVLLVIVTGREIRVYGGLRQLGSVLYHDLGLQPPHSLLIEDYYISVTLDTILMFNPDHLFISCWDTQKAKVELTRFMMRLQDMNLNAITKNQVYEFRLWLNFHAPLIHEIAIDEVLRLVSTSG